MEQTDYNFKDQRLFHCNFTDSEEGKPEEIRRKKYDSLVMANGLN